MTDSKNKLTNTLELVNNPGTSAVDLGKEFEEFQRIQERILNSYSENIVAVHSEVLKQILKREPSPEDFKRMKKSPTDVNGGYELYFDDVRIGWVTTHFVGPEQSERVTTYDCKVVFTPGWEFTVAKKKS